MFHLFRVSDALRVGQDHSPVGLIREKFIAYIQEHHPQGLPVVRAQLVGAQAPAALERTAA